MWYGAAMANGGLSSSKPPRGPKKSSGSLSTSSLPAVAPPRRPGNAGGSTPTGSRSPSLQRQPLSGQGSRSSSLQRQGLSGQGERAAPRSRFASLGLSAVASTDPGPGPSAAARQIATAGVGKEEEVLRIGQWSVRKLVDAGQDSGLIYFDITTGMRQQEPPMEVLYALDLDENAQDKDNGDVLLQSLTGAYPQEPAISSTRSPEALRGGIAAEVASHADGDAALESSESGPGERLASPRFRRIVLGTAAASKDMPLRMARDLLECLREDVSMFDQLQKRFSDIPSEKPLEFGRLTEDVQEAAAQLDVGQVSDVIVNTDKSGMQVILRHS